MDELQAELGINNDEYRLEIAGNAAARQIENYTGWTHGFWADPTVTTRTFCADPVYIPPNRVYIPQGISTATGLIVKTDTGNDGTFATTLTINTNFILFPPNALVDVPPRPYTEIRRVDFLPFTFPFLRAYSGRPNVQVTAQFGWPASSLDDVKKAWLIQSVLLFKASDAVFGAIQLGEGGFATRAVALNPIAAALLEQYSQYWSIV